MSVVVVASGAKGGVSGPTNRYGTPETPAHDSLNIIS